MAHLHLHNFSKNQPSFLEGIGQKVKTVAQIAGGIKQITTLGNRLPPLSQELLRYYYNEISANSLYKKYWF